MPRLQPMEYKPTADQPNLSVQVRKGFEGHQCIAGTTAYFGTDRGGRKQRLDVDSVTLVRIRIDIDTYVGRLASNLNEKENQ